MRIGLESRNLKSEARSLRSEVGKSEKEHKCTISLLSFRRLTSDLRLRASDFTLSSYIYSGKCNFFVVNSLIQKAIYESPKNSPGLCYPDNGAFIL
jgi:hypothetical protein